MSEGEPVAEQPAPAFEVVDVLGLCTLKRRSATLDGSVPLRVAQACLPLLEGNAFGFQVVLQRRIEVRRTLGRVRAQALEDGEALERLHRAALPMLRAEGLVSASNAWTARLAQGPTAVRTLGEQARFSLFTGLLVRPRPGVRLRLSGTRNRRSLAYDVREALITDTAAFTPLFLEVDARGDDYTLQGEVATLAPLPAAVRLRRLSLEEAPEVAEAHLAFYDRTYFETKQAGSVSRKYKLGRDKSHTNTGSEVSLDLIEAGPHGVAEAGPAQLHGPAGASPGAGSDRLVVRNAVPLSIVFDGSSVVVTPDASALAAFAEAVRARWAPTLARAAAVAEKPPHPGALLYLTKYLTPHPPGEPHFFVKPSALFRTQPGVSLLLEGVPGAGYEVLRGVVETDRFHAAPAVFQLTQPGARVEVPAGTRLLELLPVSRALLAAPFSLRQAGPLAL